MENDRRHPWKGALIFGGLILTAAISVMVAVPADQVLLELGVLIAGLLAGTVLGRFGVPRAWMSPIVLVLFMAGWFILGTAGYAWFAGFFAGICAGVAWGRIVANRTIKTPPAAPWTVDGQGFATAAEAQLAAAAALRSLEGKKRWRLSVKHGAACFEVAGDAGLGMVCHRNGDADNEQSWAVLVRAEGAADDSVKIPMGGTKGSLPGRLVHDVDSAEAAMADFFTIPEPASFGPAWVTGSEAEGTRLSA